MSPHSFDLETHGILFLIGFMGSGKTWLSHRISEREGIPRFDLDEEIEREQGSSIAEIFRLCGEEAFRKIEREVLERLCQRMRNPSDGVVPKTGRFLAVVSTGGGTPCFGDNMDRMNKCGTTFWIDTSKDVLIARLKRGRAHRPLILGLDDEELEVFIDTALEKRRPFYEKAHLRWEGDEIESSDIDKMMEHA